MVTVHKKWQAQGPKLGHSFFSLGHVQGLFLVSVFGAILQLSQTIIHLPPIMVPLWLSSVQ